MYSINEEDKVLPSGMHLLVSILQIAFLQKHGNVCDAAAAGEKKR